MLREAGRHLERVIYRAIQDAKLAGQDDTIQNEVAVRTVRWIKPGCRSAHGREIRSAQTSARRLRTVPEKSYQYRTRTTDEIGRALMPMMAESQQLHRGPGTAKRSYWPTP